MPDNIIERALVPFNPSSNTVLNKDKYNLFAPVANVNKVGMAGFNPDDFNVSDESIVSFSAKFRADIEKAVTDAAAAELAAQQAAGLAAGATLVAGQARGTAEAIDGKATEAQQNAADALEQVVGKYTKPETGIPASDLAAGVQSSLGKADSAVQTEADPTVPAWAKAESKPTYVFAEINGKPTTILGYGITDAYTKTEVDGKVASVFKYKGAVTSYGNLPTSDRAVGDVWDVTDTGKNYAWNGTSWDDLGGMVDLSNYYTKSQVDTAIADKVDKVAGKGLSTEDYTSAEKSRLAGIEAGAQVNVKPDWNASAGAAAEILNKPTIPPEQVNADWNASSGKAEILNKPTIPDAQIQSDWNQSDTGAKDYIKNKPTIPTLPSIASQAEALAGTDNTKMMTPLRVTEAFTGGEPIFITQGFLPAITAESANKTYMVSVPVGATGYTTVHIPNLPDAPFPIGTELTYVFTGGAAGYYWVFDVSTIGKRYFTDGGFVNSITVTLKLTTHGWVEKSVTSVQADWNQTDSFSAAYIKNKPTIPTVPTISTDIAADATSDVKTASPKAVKTYVDGAIPAPYTLPTASEAVLGGVKVGSGLSITDGVLSAEGGGIISSVEVLGDWS